MIGRRGPGLMGTMARTAVIAGTATAVSGNVARRQAGKAQQAQMAAEMQQEQMKAEIRSEMEAEAAAAAPPPPPAPAAAPAPAPAADDTMAKLQQLADMKAQGVLTDAEFAAAKAKLLGL
jgi:hypothetical protein